MSLRQRLSPKEAAELLGCSVRHLRRLAIRRFPLPSVGTGQRPRVQYLRRDLEAYLRAQESPRSRRTALARGAA